MNEQVHTFATSYLYAVPAVMLLTYLWLWWQKSQVRHTAKHIIFDNKFFLRNTVFFGAITMLLLYLGRPLPGLEESIIVSQAPF
jgi:hypothetical protein